jgi:tetratricopeptide (TPR) repeat protein
MIVKVYRSFNFRLYISILIFFVSIFSFDSIAQTSADLVKSGNVLLEKTEYQDALVALDKAIKLDASNTEAFFVRGKVHFKLLDLESAFKDFNTAEEKGFNDVYLFVTRGHVLQIMGKYKESLVDLNKAIEMKKDDKDIWYRRAVSYQEMNFDYEAIDDYTKAIKLDNGFFEALLNRCILFYENDNLKNAFKDCDKAILVRQNNADAYYYRGIAKGSESGKDKEAMADFDKAIEIDPDHDEALTVRGAAKLYLGNKKGACLDWRRAEKLGNPEAQEFILNYCE